KGLFFEGRNIIRIIDFSIVFNVISTLAINQEIEKFSRVEVNLGISYGYFALESPITGRSKSFGFKGIAVFQNGARLYIGEGESDGFPVIVYFFFEYVVFIQLGNA